MGFPFWLRSAISLYIIIFGFWSVFRKIILRVLSAIPFIIRFIFPYIYQIVEIPVYMLHKKFGDNYYKIDNLMSKIGQKTYLFINKWYITWHNPEKYSLKRALIVYCVCTMFVILPHFFKIDNRMLKLGEEIYIKCENRIALCFEEQQAADKLTMALWKNFEKEMIISKTIDSFLLVRGSPSENNKSTLDWLKDGDVVIWKGKIYFSEDKTGNIEPWIKVMTQSGVEGWIQLRYIQAEEYMNIEFYMVY